MGQSGNIILIISAIVEGTRRKQIDSTAKKLCVYLIYVAKPVRNCLSMRTKVTTVSPHLVVLYLSVWEEKKLHA